MKEVKSVFYSVILLMAMLGVSRGEQTNSFSVKLNDQWATHDANKVITFVVDQYQSHTNDPKRALARGIVASLLQHWPREGTNYLVRACNLLSVSSNYLSKAKAEDERIDINHIMTAFETAIDMENEPVNSGPHADTNQQAAIFIQFPSEFPETEIIREIEDNERNI